MAAIWLATQAVRQKPGLHLPGADWHVGPPLLWTAIVAGPPGCGKTVHAAHLADLLGMRFVVDEWHDGQPLCPGALHLAQETLHTSSPGQLVLPFAAAKQLLHTGAKA